MAHNEVHLCGGTHVTLSTVYSLASALTYGHFIFNVSLAAEYHRDQICMLSNIFYQGHRNGCIGVKYIICNASFSNCG